MPSFAEDLLFEVPLVVISLFILDINNYGYPDKM